MRTYLLTIHLLIVLILLGDSLAGREKIVPPMKRPNIVFILADDMGLWAAHTYGNPEIITPNIDKLAEEGVKFTNAFCNTPVCSASRTTYLTGVCRA